MLPDFLTIPQQNPIDTYFKPILLHYLDSPSMLQKFLSAVVAEEWSRQYEPHSKDSKPLVEQHTLAKEVTNKTLEFLQGKPPAAYHEMAFALGRIHQDTTALLQAFNADCKLPMSTIPFLGSEIDITGKSDKAFTIDKANWALDREYTRLKDLLGRTKKKELAVIAEKRTTILANVQRYNESKAQHDVRVSAAFAAAFIAFKTPPDKVSPVVKGIMNGIKVWWTVSPLHYLNILPDRRKRRSSKTFGCCSCGIYSVLLIAQSGTTTR